MDTEHAGYEVEIKFRVNDHAALALRLGQLGAKAGPEVRQEDIYLSHPGRDFGASDEALRLRRIGDENVVTYKGPKLAGPTKTREEIEIPYEPGPAGQGRMARLLDRLGFRPVATIRKTRRPFRLAQDGRTMEVALDLAEGLGPFAEVETLADGPDDLPAAQAAVLSLAERLGLEEVERRSYLRMTLERLGSIGNSPGQA
jgi:adenylate cyclase class 2